MTAIRLMRWRENQALRMGVSYAGDPAWWPVDDAVPGLKTVADLLEYCRSQAVAVETWTRDMLETRTVRVAVPDDDVLVPVDVAELWACGVTYAQSRDARETETQTGHDIYAQVYHAHRPEVFFKAPGSRVVGPNQVVGLRRDATWHVPEPELTVILDDHGALLGFTVGNDMTARDLEAANPLYLPQAKMFHHSASIGPTLVFASTVDWTQLTITLEIWRRGERVLHDTTDTGRLRRSVAELVQAVQHEWPLAPWTGIMTGTGIVPPDGFALEEGDVIQITIPEVGTLVNIAQRIDPAWADVAQGVSRVLQIDPRDTVAVSLGELIPGQTVTIGTQVLQVKQSIPFGHKLALTAMAPGDWVIKYGERIGTACTSIAPGDHVHTHNVESYRGRGDRAVAKGGETL
ncbi:MAG: fumarylacetoacetate hydrolase family protein [Firmicutes bacterium]|nr:fumarylacetoacetate hydrolase family protein [Bacillota bacterium]